jgi:hypothetical protein
MPRANSAFSAPPVESLVASPRRSPAVCKRVSAARMPSIGTERSAPSAAVTWSKVATSSRLRWASASGYQSATMSALVPAANTESATKQRCSKS